MDQVPEWINVALGIAGAVGSVISSLGALAIWAIRHSLVTRDEMAKHENEHAEEHRRLEEQHNAEHRKLDRRLEDGEREFATIKKDIEHLPDADHWMELTGRVIAVEGSVNTMAAKFEGLSETLKRIEVPLNIIVENYIKGAGK
jgi:hypothetical protein